MKLENLRFEMIVKNYKLMCELLKEEVKTGKSKQLQLKDWERYFKCHKEGNKFIIDEIYEIEKEKIDNRGKSEGSRWSNRKDCDNFELEEIDWKKIGVYTITLNNDIYIGSTIAGFRKRFLQHNNKDSKTPHTKEMLDEGAIFKILWISDVKDENYIRFRENQYIKKYKKDNSWNVVNTNEAWNKLDDSIKVKKLSETQYIKIDRNNYESAMQLLQENNLI